MSPPTSNPARQLSTAAERREALIEAAVVVFAEHGYHGTPTTEIARAAGISQAYLFRLFPTKAELYVATIERCYERISAAMRGAAQDARASGEEDLLGQMGLAYTALLRDPAVLRGTLHSFAAASGGDPAVVAAVRGGYAGLVTLVKQLTGADQDRIRDFFATGMLLTVLASMDARSIDADWVATLLGGDIADCFGPDV
ncbi:MAG: transcriptional regulator, TetR family [Conexibacter sp.]|jgi:AcrR family transcriptional regulator|nr:transcriptional regulator, TetR family [Conexibacter sp.]